MRISDWSSDVCSSDLGRPAQDLRTQEARAGQAGQQVRSARVPRAGADDRRTAADGARQEDRRLDRVEAIRADGAGADRSPRRRSEERRVGKECVSTGRSRWSRSHKKKKKKTTD